MLLIAVSGSVGEGKSSLLAGFAEGRSDVDGFLQLAGERPDRSKGAETYQLKFLREGRTIPFLVRKPEGGYDALESGVEELHRWAEAVQPTILVLDEFGRWEAEGKGHVSLWPDLAAKQPQAVVLSVRDGFLEQIEGQLGRRFDLVIHAGDPRALALLHGALGDLRDWERVGVFGAGAGGIETSVGTAFHTMKFPLTGLVMASTQAVVLSIAAEKLQRRERVVWVSMISAGLKALSPAGSRLGPMLAITVQGILATAAYRIVGWNRAGAFVAGALACAWAGLQGLLIQYLLLGNGLERAFDAVAKWIQRSLNVPTPGLIGFVILIAGVYALVGGWVTSAAWSRRNRLAERFGEQLARRPAVLDRLQRKPFWKSALDLLRPSFLVPTVIVCSILLASGSAPAEVGWILLRVFAVGLALLGLVRWFDPVGFVNWLRKRGHWGPAYAFSRLFG